MNKIAVFGAGGLGKEIAMLIEHINQKEQSWEMIGFFDDAVKAGTQVYSYPVLGGQQELNNYSEELSVVFAIGDPTIKRQVISGINNTKLQFPVLIHPNVLIGRGVIIEEGTIITSGNIITVDVTIGKYVIVNLACTIGHDATIGDFSSLMPGVNISGEVEIGDGAYIGTGAKIIQQIKIGDNAIVGAGAVVVNSLPSNCTAVGVPARVIKQKVSSENKL